jgi:hypothetical protein
MRINIAKVRLVKIIGGLHCELLLIAIFIQNVLWFIKKLKKNKNGAINRSSQCNPPILLIKRIFAIFILISVKCNLSSHTFEE